MRLYGEALIVRRFSAWCKHAYRMLLILAFGGLGWNIIVRHTKVAFEGTGVYPRRSDFAFK